MALTDVANYIPSIVAVISIILAIWIVFFEKKKNPTKIYGSRINNNKTSVGILELTSYVDKLEPDYLICLNRGGILIGSHISLLLQIPTEKLLKCSIKKNESGAIVTSCDISNVEGKVLIIDSMIRTGSTFDLAVEYIESNSGKRITSFETAALVTAIDKNDKPAFDKLSHYVYSTENRNVEFPWTNLRNLKSRYNASDRRQMLENEFNLVKDLQPKEIFKSILLPSLQENLIIPCD